MTYALGDVLAPAVTPGRDHVDVEIIIPALNEEYRLPGTLRSLLVECDRLYRRSGLVTRIVVVDNGSSDRTAEVADQVASENVGRVVVIGCSTPGKGAAVRRGMLTSNADFVGFLDADLSVPAAALGPALDRLVEGTDVVIGSRRCVGAVYAVRQSTLRRAGGYVFRRVVRDLIPDVRDSQCGFKFFRREVAQEVFSRLRTDGFSFDVELLVIAHALGRPVLEIPVVWTDDAASTLNPVSHGRQIVSELVQLRRMRRDLVLLAA